MGWTCRTAVYKVVQVDVLKEGGVSKCGATGPIYCMLIRSLLLAAVNGGQRRREAYRRAARLVAWVLYLGMYPSSQTQSLSLSPPI